MKTLIILHGWQSSREKWENVKKEIEKQGTKVISLDLPGFKKETALSEVWNLDNYVEWFKDFSDKFNEPFFLLGHSFGGRIAIKFAAQYPEKLEGLILVSSAGIKPETNNNHRAMLIFAKKIRKTFSHFNFYPLARKIFYKYVFKTTDYINSEKIPFLQETFKNIIDEDLKSQLSKIKSKTLIIWGNKDILTPVSNGYLMKEKIKNSKLEILKNVGHNPYVTDFKILSEKISNFIKNF